MFSSGPNYNKMKTNLRLCSNRLKLLEKKKTETNQKARKEIADFLAINKPDRARIRVESIIREDYLVEAMEILEMFCDLLLARFGMITQLKELDEGISEAVSSIIWVAPRLQADVAELKVVSDMLQAKYGKPYADACRVSVHPANVSEKLQHKMSIQAPPKLLVEKYLIEIAKIFNIDYEPDQSIMQSDQQRPDGQLIDFNNLDGNPSFPPGLGFAEFPNPPPLPIMPHIPANVPFSYPQLPQNNYPGPSNNGPPPFNYPGPTDKTPFNYGGPPNNAPFNYPGPSNNNNNNNNNGGMAAPYVPSAPTNYNYNYNIPPNPSSSEQPEKKDLNVDFLDFSAKPKPQPRSKLPDLPNVPSNLPNLPDVPEDNQNVNANHPDDSEIDFDDLSRRFEELKKRH